MKKTPLTKTQAEELIEKIEDMVPDIIALDASIRNFVNDPVPISMRLANVLAGLSKVSASAAQAILIRASNEEMRAALEAELKNRA